MIPTSIRWYFWVVEAFAMISSGGSPTGVPNEPECPAIYNHTGYVCGIESVWVCLAATDTEFSTPLSVFHTPEFVGEWNGSSAEDLLAAVEFAGYKAELLSNISVADLRFFDHPAVLHVRGGSGRSPFNHWVAFLGMEGENARIVDSGQLVSVSWATLADNWDGVAIIIGPTRDISRSLLFANAWFILRTAVLLASLALLLKFAHGWLDRLPLSGRRRLIVSIPLFAAVVMFVGFVCDTTRTVSLLTSPSVVSNAIHRESTFQYSEVDAAVVEDAIRYPEQYCLIDTRRSLDFATGTIPGAKNVPVTTSTFVRSAILQESIKAKHVVLFCQSDQCRYSDVVAQWIKAYGIHDVQIYRGGISDWLSRGRELQPT